MCKNKNKLVFVVSFILFVLVIWVSVYVVTLNAKPKGYDAVKDGIELVNPNEETVYDATVVISDKEYTLDMLNKKILKGEVVLSVKIKDKNYQGYVSVSDMITKPLVKVFKDKNYVQVLIPEKQMFSGANAKSK